MKAKLVCYECHRRPRPANDRYCGLCKHRLEHQRLTRERHVDRKLAKWIPRGVM